MEDHDSSKKQDNTYAGKLRAKQVQNLKIGDRSSDYARVMKFNKVLSETTVILGTSTLPLMLCVTYYSLWMIILSRFKLHIAQ